MELIGFYYEKNGDKKELYLDESNNKGFCYLTNKNKSKVYEWFIFKTNVITYCNKNFNNFEEKK
ncbi:MAG: hypothetical protein ABF289_12680 [Clostridiales bacterium]